MSAMSISPRVNFYVKPPQRDGRNLPKSRDVHDVPFSTTLLVRDHCLCLHLQKAARAVARRFDLALKPTGLTNGQFSMLISLNRPDHPDVPLATIGNIADLLGMDRTTVTAAARILSRRNLLRLAAHPSIAATRCSG